MGSLARGMSRADHATKSVLAMTPDRIAYEGPLGTRSVRSLGAYTIYSSTSGPIRVCTNGEWGPRSDLVLVNPFVEHLVEARRNITEILLEVESISPEGMQACWQALDADDKRRTALRLADAIRVCKSDTEALKKQSFDGLFFGKELERRKLDTRITTVIHRICSTHEGPSYSVKTLATEVDLSPSRLTHFFSEQLGITIRRFRAWKRARMVMPIALQERNLLNLALEAGYADSTHFSHSMRSVFGLKARDLCEGSRLAAVSMSMAPWKAYDGSEYGLTA